MRHHKCAYFAHKVPRKVDCYPSVDLKSSRFTGGYKKCLQSENGFSFRLAKTKRRFSDYMEADTPALADNKLL